VGDISVQGIHEIAFEVRDLERSVAFYTRGSNHMTHRFGGQIEFVAAKELPLMAEAGNLERALKRKKNPRLAISMLRSTS
jgi:catechol 2,3-dioxygenase-like lactoylglutathione lyase family enzyme